MRIHREFPPEFFCTLFGAVTCGALLLWLLYVLYRRGGVWRRLTALGTDDNASAIVEFPYAVLVLVKLTLFTMQLSYMTTAYLVVDYAAYAAARSAIVIVPEELSDDEKANKIKVPDSPGEATWKTSGKFKHFFESAAMCCYPISGHRFNVPDDLRNKWESGAGMIYDLFFDPNGPMNVGFNPDPSSLTAPIDGAQTVMDTLAEEVPWLTRFFYSLLFTRVELKEATAKAGDTHEYGKDTPITAVVTHWYHLRIPWVRVIFATDPDDKPWSPLLDVVRWQTPIKASVTLVSETQIGVDEPKQIPDRYPKD